MPRLASGAQQLRDVARDLQRAGLPVRGLSRKLRRNITAAAAPVVVQVRANALAIPTHGDRHTGLRESLAHATRISVTPLTKRTASVRLIVDGKRMPAGQESLPGYMEGDDGRRTLRWRHPVFGPHDSSTWRGQDSHPYVAPAVYTSMPGIQRAVLAACDETAAQLVARGY